MEGRCHCGAIRFKVTGTSADVGTCYCIDCQKISGGPSMTMADFKIDEYILLQGKPKEYKSSAKVVRTFCANCGSALSYAHADYPERVEIPVGTFNNPSLLAPTYHMWVSQKPLWVQICDNLPQRERD